MVKLRPNCLLTRYPVCFLHGRKTLFNFFNYWKGAPDYLRAHGYEIFELAAPWRGSRENRIAYWLTQFSALQARFDKIHVLAHAEAGDEVAHLFRSPPTHAPFMKSVTLLDHHIPKDAFDALGAKSLVCELRGPGTKKPQHPLTKLVAGSKLSTGLTPSLFLDHCIFLAEHDLKTSQ